MANGTPSSAPKTLSLPALLGQLQILLVIIAAVLLSAVVLTHALVYLWQVPNVGWVALVNAAVPAVGVLLMTVATYIGWYGTWRIARRKDTYDVHSDIKTHAADIPYALSRLGCVSALSSVLLAGSLLATALTYAPPPFDFLGGPTTPPSATATPVPTLTVALSSTQSSWDCNTSGREIAPVTLTLDNSASNVDARWTAVARETVGSSLTAGPPTGTPWATAKPSQGTIPAGHKQTIELAPVVNDCVYSSPVGTPYHLDIIASSSTAPSTNSTFTYTIAGLRRLRFGLKPSQYPPTGAWGCPNSPPPVTITLDNTGSNVDVGWQVSFPETLPQSQTPWASASQSSGTVAAGGSAEVTITPAANACELANQNGAITPVHAQFTLTSGGGETYTFTYDLHLQIIG